MDTFANGTISGVVDISSGPVTYQRETVARVVGEIMPYLEEEWREIGRNHGKVTLKVDVERYRKVEMMGGLRIFTVREGGKLVGWAIYMLAKHMNYSDHKFAKSNVFWLHPALRGCGLGRQLFEFVAEQLGADGISVMHTTTKVAHPQAGRVLEDCGHTLIEYGYEKVLI